MKHDLPLRPQDCPRWSGCSAAICPLDPAWRDRVMRKDEAVCSYLREAVKPGAEANSHGGATAILLEVVHQLHPDLLARHAPLKKPLKRAAQTPSRIGRQPTRTVIKQQEDEREAQHVEQA